MFRRLHDLDKRSVTIDFEGEFLKVGKHETVAAALLAAGPDYSRTTPVSRSPRLPFCMMGVCFDCLCIINGEPNRQACMTLVQQGMTIHPQPAAVELDLHGQVE